MVLRGTIFILTAIWINIVYAQDNLKPAVTAPIPIDQIKNYVDYPMPLKKLINAARNLSEKNLTYQFGSANPNNPGMDCSGTIFYLLTTMNVPDAPRDAENMYQWVKKAGHFHPVKAQDFSSPEYDPLKPGDLLFWSGTYHNAKAISHVMLYLGKNLKNEPLMFGSSDGRTYVGKKMWGVSVFDFRLPNNKSTASFVGYSCIPTLTCEL